MSPCKKTTSTVSILEEEGLCHFKIKYNNFRYLLGTSAFTRRTKSVLTNALIKNRHCGKSFAILVQSASNDFADGHLKL